jgi:exo-beta-1,3-glucanase (GH17 family)
MSKGYQAAYEVSSKSSASTDPRAKLYAELQPDLPGTAIFKADDDDRRKLFRQTLQRGMHGIAFSPYMDGQSPGDEITPRQIRQRLEVIKPFTRWIRTFSCTEGNQHSPAIAKAMDLNTMVGVGISDDRDMNEIELANGIEIARAGHADILAVGNEVLLRGDLSEDELIDYMERARAELPGVAIGYVDAYFLFENHPRVTAACDRVLINCYPFWESCPAEYALLYMKEMYRRALSVANGKEVIISETGWPDRGTPFGAAQPGTDNAINYFINTYQWAEQEGIKIFYFSSFDESWKVGDEGDVGAYWGLWDSQGQLKYA